MCMNRTRYTIIVFTAHVNPSNTFKKTNAEQSGVVSAADLRRFHADTMTALLLGSSAAHQRLRWLRFDLDKRVNERERGSKSVCMVSLRSSIQQLNTQLQCPVPVHWPTASLRNLLALLFPHRHLEGWWRPMRQTKKTFIPFPSISFLSMLEQVTWKLADSSKHILFSLASLYSINLHYFLYPLLSLPL